MKNKNMSDTIYAFATPIAKSGMAVLRISGENAISTLHDLGYHKEIIPRRATYCKFIYQKHELDCGLFIFFQAPHSFTGEDIVELYLHGSIAVMKEALEILSQIKYLRMAEPGEFSKRAFLNGKIDLTMAEGLSDLINAETAIQKKIALRQMSGEYERLYDGWRNQIIKIAAKIEALIDFPEDDIPKYELEHAKDLAHNLGQEIQDYLSKSRLIETITDGIKVVIFGPPNAGKSSLINLLTQQDVAIISNIPGTTRDIIRARIIIDGFMINILDTAGIRLQSTDEIEVIGIQKALTELNHCDIKILVLDIDDPITYTSFLENNKNLIDHNTIILLNKADLLDKREELELFAKSALSIFTEQVNQKNIIGISLLNKDKIYIIIDVLRNKLQELDVALNATLPILIKKRYQVLLQEACSFLSDTLHNDRLDLLAEDIRMAARCIGEITGSINIEEILDVLFGSFCIGK